MIKHIVMYRFKNEEDIGKAASLLMSMKGRVSEVLEIETGRDFLNSPRSYSLVLIVTLKDRAALDSYQANSYHVEKVKSFMHSVVTEAASVDYEY